MPTTTIKKPASKRPATKPKISTLLQDQLTKQAARTAAGFALLADIERRTEKIHPGSWRLSPAELLLISNEFPSLSNNHTLAGELQRVRAARSLREDGLSIEGVRSAQKMADYAKQACLTAEADLEDPGDTLVSHLKKQQAHLKGLHQTAKDAEQDLVTVRGQYESLLRLAPKPLVVHGEECVARSQVRQLESQLEKVDRQINGTKGKGNALAAVNVKEQGDDANMHASVCAMGEQFTFKGDDGNKLLIDQEACHEEASLLLNEVLPRLEREAEELKTYIQEERDRVRESLHRWAETGELTVQMLLDN